MLVDMTTTHVPVLAGELVDLLDPRPGELAVDCTFGGGGHARLVAERLGPGGELIAIDRDPAAEERFAELAAEVACRTRFIRAPFAEALEELRDEGVVADLVYLDLGMSSMQVDTRERGFSYAYDAPLDMRMDPDDDLTAADVVNEWDERRLATLFRDYGEERYARPIARAIVRARAPRPAVHDQRARRDHHRRRPGARALRRRPPGQARLPGDPHRGQRRARPARRGAARRLGAAPRPWPICRDFLPFAGRPTREALPRRPGRGAASARRTSRCAAAAASRRPSCSPAAPSRPRQARSPPTHARSPPGCAPPGSWMSRGRRLLVLLKTRGRMPRGGDP